MFTNHTKKKNLSNVKNFSYKKLPGNGNSTNQLYGISKKKTK